jgi:hypothetical protein
MKQTAVEWLYETLWKQTDFSLPSNILDQAKEMEKKQLIDCGNSCAFKQHIHNARIDKMTESEIRQFAEEEHLTFGEEYYNETFKKK